MYSSEGCFCNRGSEEAFSIRYFIKIINNYLKISYEDYRENLGYKEAIFFHTSISNIVLIKYKISR